ncbi:hypothetical protein DAI22_01g089700 [Oryza sativa Japonica Group]|nr:hypothetical protein DAI22_01g089700 [Oryza sativa Japonica Group]
MMVAHRSTYGFPRAPASRVQIISVKSKRRRSIPPPTSLNHRTPPLPQSRNRRSLSRSPTRTCATARIPLPHALTPERAPPSVLPSLSAAAPSSASPICHRSPPPARPTRSPSPVLCQDSRRRRSPSWSTDPRRTKSSRRQVATDAFRGDPICHRSPPHESLPVARWPPTPSAVICSSLQTSPGISSSPSCHAALHRIASGRLIIKNN